MTNPETYIQAVLSVVFLYALIRDILRGGDLGKNEFTINKNTSL